MNQDEAKFKTHDYIAFFVLAALVIFGIISYYVQPKDLDQVKEIVRALIDALGMILAFKFGVHVQAAQQTVPTPPAGGSIRQTTEASVQSPPIESVPKTEQAKL